MRTVRRILGVARIASASACALTSASCAIDGPTALGPRGSTTDARIATMASPATSDDARCDDCIFGPETFLRDEGPPTIQTVTFQAVPGSSYVAELQEVVGKGGIGGVALNGQTLFTLSPSPNVGTGPGRVPVELAATNTLVARLVGKPGTGVRLAIHALAPLTLDAVTFKPSTNIEIDGVGTAYDFTITNRTKWPRRNIGVVGWVLQGSVGRQDGGALAACGAAPAEVPPGTCVSVARLAASNAPSAGPGTFVPGSADAKIYLVESGVGGLAILDSRTVPVTLIAPVPPSVVQVTVTPNGAQMGAGTFMWLTADVEVTGNAPRTVTWTSSNPQIATVDVAGKVTAVSAGNVTITATSTADPTKKGSAFISVFEFRITSPSGPVNVSTGATVPPLNSLSVRITATTCGMTAVFNPNIARVEFFANSNGDPIVIGSANIATTDNGVSRCWFASTDWAPGTAFGIGPQVVYAIGYRYDGTIAAPTQLISWISTTNP